MKTIYCTTLITSPRTGKRLPKIGEQMGRTFSGANPGNVWGLDAEHSDSKGYRGKKSKAVSPSIILVAEEQNTPRFS